MKNLTAAQPAAHTPRLARIAICLSFLIFALPASAAQQSLASNGRIAFGDSSTPIVWSVRPDGSDLRVLTALPSSGDYIALIRGVSFSADGSRLAVLYEQIGTQTRCGASFNVCWSIVMMNGDGTNHHFI